MNDNFDFDKVLMYAKAHYFSYLSYIERMAEKKVPRTTSDIFAVTLIENELLKDMLSGCGIDVEKQYDIWYEEYERISK